LLRKQRKTLGSYFFAAPCSISALIATTAFSSHSSSVTALTLWLKISANTIAASILDTFKSKLKTKLFT